MAANEYKVFHKPQDLLLTRRKLEGYNKIAEITNYYRRNPIKFMEDILGVQLQDSQKYVLQMAWNTPYVLLNCTRGWGKSSIIDALIMAKTMLYPSYGAYIASGTGGQAQQTFQTLINIAQKNINSMASLTDIFSKELEIRNATGDGFIRNPEGYYYNLYNKSFCKTLNSNVDRRRGNRANLVVFDECGWLDANLMNVFGAFTIVNEDAKTGADIDQTVLHSLPLGAPHQLIYISSASQVGTPFYQKYRDFQKKMLEGDRRYFVAELNCDIAIHPTIHGKAYAPFLKQETVDNEMRMNPEKALREYYCRFTDEGGVNQIIPRSKIEANSYVRPPVLYNDTGKRKFIMAFDPARSMDNSIVSIGELIDDPKEGLKLDIVNCVSMIDIMTKKKTPKTTTQQIIDIRQLLIDYNGAALDYDNIEVFLADAGSGGGGNSWVADNLFEDWVDVKGNKHHGLIDREQSADYVQYHPLAVPKLKLIQPSKQKSEMFEALIRMIDLGLISFPANYDNKGFLEIPEVDVKKYDKEKKNLTNELKAQGIVGAEFDEKLEEALSQLDISKFVRYNLSPDEEIALAQIDAMKEEAVNIIRFKQESGKDRFGLPPHKDSATGASESTLHDDRIYTLAMLAWYLQEKRMEGVRQKRNQNADEDLQNFVFRPAKRNRFM